MKALMLILVSVLLLTSCKPKAGGMATPEATFETLLTAIKNKDLATYEKCWLPERAASEGEVDGLRENPAKWEELQGIFKGPQKLTNKEERERDGRQMVRFEVEAPEAEQGGIGGLAMVKDGNEWKMYTW